MTMLGAAWPAAPCHCGPWHDALFEGQDALAVSPGVAVAGPLTDPAVAAARSRGLPFVGDIELFALALTAEHARSGYRPRVLAITGSIEPGIHEKVFEHGAYEFLPKPFRPTELAGSIGRLLG